MIPLRSKLPTFGTNIFTIMTQLANEAGAINLAQGFPDIECPPSLIELVNKYMRAGKNQYAPTAGVHLLRERVANMVNEAHGSDYDSEQEVTISCGATNAIATALTSTIQPDDEVVIFEPAFDCYAPMIKILGGHVKVFTMNPPNFHIDWSFVKKLLTARTKMIIVNSPHNPSGTILKKEDMLQLIRLVEGTNILILSDEVYEHMVFDGEEHVSVARFKALKERSFIVASFGKLFHNTGWRLGYCLAPNYLMKEYRKVHQYNLFSVCTPMQHALADHLADKHTYLELKSFFQEKRDRFSNGLKQTKFELLPCKGTYFQSVKYDKITDEDDLAFAKRLTSSYGVAAIPFSPFYTGKKQHHLLRFCFAKKNETIDQALEKLHKLT